MEDTKHEIQSPGPPGTVEPPDSACGCDTDYGDEVKPIEALGAARGKVHYGGQAVIEGVMMRGPQNVAVAVRTPWGAVDVHSEPFVSASRRNRFLRLPVIRGGLSLIESLSLGIRALNWSASAAMEAEEAPDAEKAAEASGEDVAPEKAAEASGEDAATEKAADASGEDVATEKAADASGEDAAPERTPQKQERLATEDAGWKTKLALTGTMVFAFGLGILFFFYIPLVLSEWLTAWMGSDSSIIFNLVDGVIRVVFFLAYIWGISQWREMRRVFEYHGAEHKTIFCHEAELPLTVENAQQFTTRHPRCGTSFLLIVMVTSILVFMLTGKPANVAHRLLRLLLIPVIAGISYEIMKLAAVNATSRWARLLSAPGVWLQGITTKEPSDDQIEVAIAALKAAKGERPAAGSSSRDAGPSAGESEAT